MNDPHPPSSLSALRPVRPRQLVGAGPWVWAGQAAFCLGYVLRMFVAAGLLWACHFSQPTDLERVQADNMRLTKTLHNYLNRQDWPAVADLCAKTVRYRGRATHFAEVNESRATFMTHYRNPMVSARPGGIEIRQLYPAGAYHVIVEGIAAGEPPNTTLPVCLIYTIEDNHITRLYAY